MTRQGQGHSTYRIQPNSHDYGWSMALLLWYIMKCNDMAGYSALYVRQAHADP
jgi:hypothetical protein